MVVSAKQGSNGNNKKPNAAHRKSKNNSVNDAILNNTAIPGAVSTKNTDTEPVASNLIPNKSKRPQQCYNSSEQLIGAESAFKPSTKFEEEIINRLNQLSSQVGFLGKHVGMLHEMCLAKHIKHFANVRIQQV